MPVRTAHAAFWKPVTDKRCSVFDPPEDQAVQRFTRSVLPQGKRVKDQTFGFDRVFDENITQGDVYEATTKNLLDSVLDGYNATVFAYGATGCGKTHTITGTAQQPGIIFLTMQELFEKVGELQSEKATEITLSYLEIYNETIRDLMAPNHANKQGLMLREDANQVVSVAGLSSHNPQNVQEVMDMVITGNSNRTQSPTEANATSSRSHAVLQVNVSSKSRDTSVSEPVTMATLSIIDLAGSERASATKNRGERLMEGANINKSLLALGSCINALCDPRKKNHIPYRNSKLTRLLKFSLGGNCRTVMIVCVSPSSQHFDETQNTLRYANRAKNIQTKSVRNVYNVDRHVKDYLKKIDEQMARINELTTQQKQYEEMAFVKFRKAEAKRSEIAHDGMQRIRAAFDHSTAERQERVGNMRRLRQVERRIGAISGWIGAFDQVCDAREDEDAPKSMVAMRKTAQGILVELEGSRQHFHQRLAKSNWSRAIEMALQDSLRQLQALGASSVDNLEESSLHREVEGLKSKADVEAHLAVLDQERLSDQGLTQVLLTAHFETVAILNQILQMSEQEAVEAAREVLGKLLQSCAEAVSQVIKPDGGLQITEAIPPSKSGTPRRKRQMSIMGPSPLKAKIRPSLGAASASALPPHMADHVAPPFEGSSSGNGPSTASPRRRVKLGGARRGVVMNSTPKKKSPSKKRAVRWRDENDDGEAALPLVDFQPTPKFQESSPALPEEVIAQVEATAAQHASEHNDDSELNSSPLPSAPISSSELRRSGGSRFATGFLTKKTDGSPPPPSLNLSAFANEDETTPLRELHANRAPHLSSNIRQSPATGSPALRMPSHDDDAESVSSGSDLERTLTADKETAGKIRSAMKLKRTSSSGRNSGAQLHVSRARNRDSVQGRRSPTATSPPPQSDGQSIFSASHARRMVRSEKEDGTRSVLSPRTAPVLKGTGPMAARRSMAVEGTPKEAGVQKAPIRVSSIAPGSAQRQSSLSKAAWR
jgi:kinesin family protein 18/19